MSQTTERWRDIRVGDCCVVGDGAHASIARQIDGVLYLTSKNFKPFGLDLSKVDYISEHDFQRHFRENSKAIAKPKSGDVLVSIIGSLGEPYVVRPTDRFGLSSSVAILRPQADIVVPHYLYYWMKSHVFQAAVYGIKGGVAQSYLSLEMIRSLPVRVPSVGVQLKLVDVLRVFDELIEDNTRRTQILEQMAQMLYREWFVNFRFPGHETVEMSTSDEGAVPVGWDVRSLGDVADIQWGDTSVTKSSYVTSGGYQAYSASGPDGQLNYYDFERTGIVVSAIGANCGLTWFASGRWSCIKNTIRFWAREDKTTTEYLYYATKGIEFWPKRGSAQPFISQGDSRAKQIIVPPLELAQKFGEVAGGHLRLMKVLERANQNLRQTRDLLLPKLISGQISVENLDTEAVPQTA